MYWYVCKRSDFSVITLTNSKYRCTTAALLQHGVVVVVFIFEDLRKKKRPNRFLKIVPGGGLLGILEKNKLQKPQRSTIHNIFLRPFYLSILLAYMPRALTRTTTPTRGARKQGIWRHEQIEQLSACLNLFRPGWNGWNGTRLLVVVRSIPSCLCPF